MISEELSLTDCEVREGKQRMLRGPVDRAMKIPGPVRPGLPVGINPIALAFLGMPEGSLGSGVHTVSVRYHHHRFLTAHPMLQFHFSFLQKWFWPL